MLPAVSILLPVRDGAPTIDAAIASLVAQTERDWELLVLDDGSRDDTPARLARWAAREARLRVVRRPPEGLVSVLNHGLELARAPFIARMDADDIADPARLARQAALLRHEPALGLASCLVAFGGDPMGQAGYARHVAWLNTLVTPEQIALNRFVESPLAHPSVMFRRELVSAWGGYRDGDFPEDYELWLRWLEAGVRMAKVPEVLLTWNDPPARLSRQDRRYGPEAFFRVKAPYLARAAQAAAAGRGIWIWGAGRPTRKRAAYLQEHDVEIVGYIDIDPRKTGRVLGGRWPVVGPEALPPASEAFVLGYVTNPGARELIRNRLTSAGFREGRDFLMAA